MIPFSLVCWDYGLSSAPIRLSISTITFRRVAFKELDDVANATGSWGDRQRVGAVALRSPKVQVRRAWLQAFPRDC